MIIDKTYKSRNKNILFLFLIFFQTSCDNNLSNTYEISSPDKSIKVNLEHKDGGLYYTIKKGATQIVSLSKLGLILIIVLRSKQTILYIIILNLNFYMSTWHNLLVIINPTIKCFWRLHLTVKKIMTAPLICIFKRTKM